MRDGFILGNAAPAEAIPKPPGERTSFRKLASQTGPAMVHFSANAVFQGLSEFSERLLVKTSTYLSHCYLAALGWDGGLVNLHTVAPEVSMYP